MSANVAYLQDSQALDHLQAQFDAQRRAYAANPMPPAGQRLQWLKALRDLLSGERQALINAISQDFSHRSADETLFAELMPSLHGIHYASKHLKGWMKPSRRAVGLAFQPASAKVIYQPLGVIGVIVPWNYPPIMVVTPLVSASSICCGQMKCTWLSMPPAVRIMPSPAITSVLAPMAMVTPG